MIEVLLDHGHKTSQKDSHGSSLIHYSAAAGLVELTKKLMPSSNVNSTNNKGITPCHLACFYKHSSVIEILVKTTDWEDVRDASGMTALDVAIATMDNEVIETMGTRGHIFCDLIITGGIDDSSDDLQTMYNGDVLLGGTKLEGDFAIEIIRNENLKQKYEKIAEYESASKIVGMKHVSPPVHVEVSPMIRQTLNG
jgi:hypothetical protein